MYINKQQLSMIEKNEDPKEVIRYLFTEKQFDFYYLFYKLNFSDLLEFDPSDFYEYEDDQGSSHEEMVDDMWTRINEIKKELKELGWESKLISHDGNDFVEMIMFLPKNRDVINALLKL